MYSDFELFSHFGGNLSFWLGLSFVAMYEFAEKVLIILKNTIFFAHEVVKCAIKIIYLTQTIEA